MAVILLPLAPGPPVPPFWPSAPDRPSPPLVPRMPLLLPVATLVQVPSGAFWGLSPDAPAAPGAPLVPVAPASPLRSQPVLQSWNISDESPFQTTFWSLGAVLLGVRFGICGLAPLTSRVTTCEPVAP